jgi:hypothetical protein
VVMSLSAFHWHVCPFTFFGRPSASPVSRL